MTISINRQPALGAMFDVQKCTGVQVLDEPFVTLRLS